MEKYPEIYKYLPTEVIDDVKTVHLMAGDHILTIDNMHDPTLYYILEGTITVYTLAYNGRSFLVDTLGPGEFIGKFSQMRNMDFRCGADATTDCTVFDLTPVRNQILKDPLFGSFFFGKTSNRVYVMYKLAMLRMIFPYDEALAYWLLELANERGMVTAGKNELCLKMNISERQYFYLMKEFSSKRYVRKFKQGILILDRPALEETSARVRDFMKGSTSSYSPPPWEMHQFVDSYLDSSS
jgi:CRP-like cAMP-binding protein